MRLRAWDDQCWSNALPLTVNSETVHSLFAFSGFRWPFAFGSLDFPGLGLLWPSLSGRFLGVRSFSSHQCLFGLPEIENKL